MARTFYAERAEQEANKIGMQFAHSSDVARDMSRAYHVDFSNIKVHHDAAADSKVRAAGKDALAQGNDLFFGKGIFESNDPASKGLVAHEFAHTMQQGAVEGAGVVQESAPMGAEQGGSLKDWFKKKFGRKSAQRKTMQELAEANEGQQQNAAPVYDDGRTMQDLAEADEFWAQYNAAPVYDDGRTMQDLAEADEFWAQFTPAPVYDETSTMQELAAENEWQAQHTDAPVYDDGRTMQDLAEADEFWAQFNPAPVYDETSTMQELAAENEWQAQHTDAPVYDDGRTMQDLAEADEFWAQYNAAPVYDDGRTMQDLAEADEFWAQFNPAPVYDETDGGSIQSMADVPKVKAVAPEVGRKQMPAKKHTPFFSRIYQKLRRRKAKSHL